MVGHFRNEERAGQVGPEQSLGFFGLYLDAAGADDVIASPENVETMAVWVELHNIVGGELLTAQVGCADDKTAIGR